MIKKCLLFQAIFLLVFSIRISGNNDQELPSGPGVGIVVGGPTVGGITYRQFFGNRYGLQTTIVGYPTSRNLDIFSGFALFYQLNQNVNKYRVYALISSAFGFENLTKISFVPGIGIGFEFSLFRAVYLALDLAVGPFIHINYSQHFPWYLPLPMLGAGLTYYF